MSGMLLPEPDAIKAIRANRGVSLRQAAAEMGVAPSVLHQFETGTDVRLSTARKIALWSPDEVLEVADPANTAASDVGGGLSAAQEEEEAHG